MFHDEFRQNPIQMGNEEKRMKEKCRERKEKEKKKKKKKTWVYPKKPSIRAPNHADMQAAFFIDASISISILNLNRQTWFQSL